LSERAHLFFIPDPLLFLCSSRYISNICLAEILPKRRAPFVSSFDRLFPFICKGVGRLFFGSFGRLFPFRFSFPRWQNPMN